MLLSVVLLIAAVLRLFQLGSIPAGFYCDEAMDGNNAAETLETGHFQVFYPENNGREGLYINLAAPFVYVLGQTIWAMRLPAAIFGILTVWVVYLVAAEFFSPSIGLLSAFLTATSSWHLYGTRLTHRAAAAVFLLACAVYLVRAAFERASQGHPYARRAFIAGVVCGLGFHSYITYRASPVLIGGMLVWFFFRAGGRRRVAVFLSAFALFAAAAALVVSPLVFYFVRNPQALFQRASQVSVFQAKQPLHDALTHAWKTALMFFVAGDSNWRQNFSGRPELFWPVGLLFALGFAVAVWRVASGPARGKTDGSRDGSRFSYAILLLWLGVGALPSVLSIDPVHALRSSLMIPPVFMLGAIGAERAYAGLSRIAPRRVRIPAAAIFLLALGYEPISAYFGAWAGNPNVARAFDA